MTKRILLVALLLCLLPDSVLAASVSDSEKILQEGAGFGTDFDDQLETIGMAFLTVAKVVVAVMTAAAAVMVGFGIEDGKRTLWNWLLGAGLAVNFGAFLVDSGFWDYADSVGSSSSFTFYNPALAEKLEDMDILSGFMSNYLDGIIKPGSEAILSPCMKLMVILTLIEATWELSFKLISGDKVKYLLTVAIKLGFYMFLMENWISLMDAVSNGFQYIGLLAGGASADGVNLKPDSITKNAISIFFVVWDNTELFTSPGLALVNILCLAAIVVSLFLTALEMFMARIEFFTMALITIPLLPFAMTPKFSFLADKATGAMINLAIKVMVISFITAMAVPFLDTFTEQMKNAEGIGRNIGALLQCVLACLLVFYLAKKIPDLVTGLLNGQPSMGGSGMIDTARTAGGAAVGAVSGVTGAIGTIRGAAAIAQSKGQGAFTGTLAQLAKGAIMSRSPIQGYRRGIQRAENVLAPKNSGSEMLERLRNPETSNKSSSAEKPAAEGATEQNPDKVSLEKEAKQVKNTQQANKYVDETAAP